MGPITGPFLSVLRTMLVTIAAIFFINGDKDDCFHKFSDTVR